MSMVEMQREECTELEERRWRGREEITRTLSMSGRVPARGDNVCRERHEREAARQNQYNVEEQRMWRECDKKEIVTVGTTKEVDAFHGE
jgi:hypothetical protein